MKYNNLFSLQGKIAVVTGGAGLIEKELVRALAEDGTITVLDEQGYARLMIQLDEKIYRRQAAPPVFDIVTVAYAARPEFVLNANSMFEGKIKAVTVPVEPTLDIDTELDFKFAEFLLGQPSPNR